jgi:hypothetical protein
MPSKLTTVTQQSTITVIDYIQSDTDWVPNTDKDVNPIPADLIAGYTAGGGAGDPTGGVMTYINHSKTQGGGGLISKSYPLAVPGDGKPMWLGMDWKILIPSKMYPLLMRLELDNKIMLGDATKTTPTPPLQMNGSNQYRPDTGQWQADPDGKGWQDIGFKPAPLLLDAANDVRFRWWWNGVLGAGGKWSTVAMAQNGEFTVTDPKFLNVPLIAQAWGGPIHHPQVQTELQGAPAWHGLTLVRGRLMQSNLPIPLDLAWQ